MLILSQRAALWPHLSPQAQPPAHSCPSHMAVCRDPSPRQVLVNDPKELEKIREREADITKERIQKILDAGANVILTTKVGPKAGSGRAGTPMA